jgi:hypothetical protein
MRLAAGGNAADEFTVDPRGGTKPMSIEAEKKALAAKADAKRRAIELYRTTRFTARAIAKDAGVSGMTLYRWLHDEGVPLRRHADNDPAISSDEEPPPSTTTSPNFAGGRQCSSVRSRSWRN